MALAAVVLLAIAYIAFAALYMATRIGPAPDADLRTQVPKGGVSVVFVPQRVDPERESIQGEIRILIDRANVPSDVTVRVFPFLDTSQIVIPAGEAAVEQEASLTVEGEVRAYPFDHYEGGVQISASSDQGSLPVVGGILPINGLTGWNFSVASGADSTPKSITDTVYVERSLTTRVTVMILAALTLVLGAIAIALAWSVAVGRKESSFGEATWIAATTFSVISVRNFMPGAPPIGAYLDSLAIIPAILALFLSMAVLVVLWLTRDTSQEPD